MDLNINERIFLALCGVLYLAWYCYITPFIWKQGEFVKFDYSLKRSESPRLYLLYFGVLFGLPFIGGIALVIGALVY